MNDKTDDDAYDALFRSYKDSNKRIKELEIQCGHFRLTISKLESLLVQAGSNVKELQAELAAATAEITRMRERLAALSEEWRTTETSSLRVNEMLLAHADALTEAIAAHGGEEE